MELDLVKKVLSEAKVILLDIEGTTTSISFVKDKLFPYAEAHLENYIKTNWDNEQTKQIIISLVNNQDAFKDNNGFILLPPVPTDATKVKEFSEKLISHLKWQQANDFKTTELKTLQGYVWINGYQNKEIEGHVYDDVPGALEMWKKQGKKIFIYSSGSVAAQKLLFKFSKFGDLDSFIDGNFDTTIGPKTESESYLKIMQELNVEPECVVFFTDRPKEVFSAKVAKMNVMRMERNEPNAYLLEEEEYLGKEDSVLESFAVLKD